MGREPSSLLLLLSTLLFGASCTVSTTRRQPIPEENEPANRGGSRTAIRYDHANDSPEISRSSGNAGGVVVLWPRILPRTEDPKILDLANKVQARLERIAKKSTSDVDRRPSPERVCPKGEGCKATSLGAVIAVKDKGCAVVATVGPAGVQPVKLVPLAATVKLDKDTSPFREPPENLVVVQEFVPCDKLIADLDSNVTLEGEEAASKAVEAAKSTAP
ncbi:MAG: hypothetical protein HOW73_26505 [Polyangiaceae bacterium]|nr:hypothetical protein [Polyangiaceae bacterium]